MKMLNKPMSHWEQMAHEMVVEELVRAALKYSGKNPSVPGKIAAKRLWELANVESPETVQKVLAERDACLQGLAAFRNSIAPDSARDGK